MSFNGVYWTLVYEVQFYAVYPVLLWCVRKVGVVPIGAVLLCCEISLAYVPTPVTCFFLNKHFEWYLGLIAAEAMTRYPAGVRMSSAIVCTILGFGGAIVASFDRTLFAIRDLFFATGYFGLLLLVVRGRGKAWAFANFRAFVYLGAFSYSLYLIHVPLIDVVWVGIDRLLAQRSPYPGTTRWLSVVAVPLSVGVAYIFYRIFERPFFGKQSQVRSKSI